MLDSLMFFVTLAAVVGAIANARKKRWSFLIWIVTNSVFVCYNWHLEAFSQVALFGVYVLISISGWINWGKQRVIEECNGE